MISVHLVYQYQRSAAPERSVRLALIMGKTSSDDLHERRFAHDQRPLSGHARSRDSWAMRSKARTDAGSSGRGNDATTSWPAAPPAANVSHLWGTSPTAGDTMRFRPPVFGRTS